MKQTMTLAGILLAFALSLASCGGNSTEKARIAEFEEQLEGSGQFIGTYKVVDKSNTTWILTLNRDETMTINEEGSSEVRYGSWSDSTYGVPYFSFGNGESTYLEFPSGREYINFGILSDGYLYSSSTEYKAQNPKSRLPITKIK